MAAISLLTAGRVEVIESHDQLTLSCGVDVTAGCPVYPDTSGNWAIANATDTAHSTGMFITTRAAKKGESVTAIRAGSMDGFDVSGMAYGASIYLSDTAGTIATTAGTTSVVVGRVTPAIANSFQSGAARDKIVRFAFPL